MNRIKSLKLSPQNILKKGLDEDKIRLISKIKNEPEWMLEFRLKSYRIFKNKKIPDWGPDLTKINFDNIVYYYSILENSKNKWKDIPKDVKKIYEDLGIPQAEKEFLGGVSAQFESEVVYKNLFKKYSQKGIIFSNTDEALKKYPKIFKKYFGKLVPPTDNKFSALNSAVWSGGSFIYVPKNVKIDLPLQAFFLIDQKNTGQFERTLIIAEEGSFIHYIEGCTAPRFSTNNLHSAVVEVFVGKKARVRYTTVQNWSKNVLNLTTKRSIIEEGGIMEWIDANIGSGITMKYPSCILKGENSKAEVLSIAVAGKKQNLDTGAKMIHLAGNTSSRIISKSISKSGGNSIFRGLIKVNKNLKNVKSFINCDALILDKYSQTQTYPQIDIESKNAHIEHEARVEKMDQDKLNYLITRGIPESQAISLIANGFIDPVVKEIPLEYAVEMNRLLEKELNSTIG